MSLEMILPPTYGVLETLATEYLAAYQRFEAINSEYLVQKSDSEWGSLLFDETKNESERKEAYRATNDLYRQSVEAQEIARTLEVKLNCYSRLLVAHDDLGRIEYNRAIVRSNETLVTLLKAAVNPS